MKSQKTIQMAELALMSAVLCIISPFTIPLPTSPVPLSLSLLGVYLSAILLGGKRASLSVLVYLLLGMVGLPVFSGFSGGIGVLAGPTGGYLIGYVLCAAVVGGLSKRGGGRKNKNCEARSRLIVRNIFVMAIGTLVCYLFGTGWFLLIMKGTYTIAQALMICVVPYLIFDIIKILAAAAIALPIQRILRRIEQG